MKAVGKAGGRTLVFIHIFCRIVSERGGRDRFPNGPREWWANGMPFRPKHSQFIRPDASERGGRLQNGHHKIAKRSLAWRVRSEGKSVPAISKTALDPCEVNCACTIRHPQIRLKLAPF